VHEKAEIGAIDAVALQLGNGALQLFRIVENGYSLANCRMIHIALLSVQLSQHNPSQRVQLQAGNIPTTLYLS
jgi:hypothetical protein